MVPQSIISITVNLHKATYSAEVLMYYIVWHGLHWKRVW